MPASIALAEEFGDDLAVLFVERQGATSQEAEAFAYGKKWMGTTAMWTKEVPVRVPGNTLPRFALLSAEGELLLSGNPLAMKKQIEEALENEFDAVKKGPPDAPKAIAKAWVSYAKGDVGKAFAEFTELVAGGGEDGAAAAEALADLRNRVDRRLKRIAWMVENGPLLEAKDQAEALASKAGDWTEVADAAKAQLETLSGDAFQAEVAAEKELVKLEEKAAKKGLEKIEKNLAKFPEKHAGTLAAKRAQHLLAVLETMAD